MMPSAAAIYVVDVAVHLMAQLAGWAQLADVTQWVAMPLLMIVLLTWAQSSRLVHLVAVALIFSWLGDTLPHFFDGDTAFLILVGCFLCAQIVYIAAFWGFRHRSLARSPWLLLYVAAITVLVWLCAPSAGSLLVPVLIYGLALGVMAVLASGVHPVTGIGGALFLISDGLIAIGAFRPDIHIPAAGFLVMATYLIGQGLIVLGVIRRARASGEEPSGDEH